MLSVTEAKEIIAKQVFERKRLTCSPVEAVNGVLAVTIYALTDIPAFRQSSMDGFAFAFKDLKPGKPLQVVEEIPAGRSTQLALEPGQAARIFTGAAIPDEADTVVMQEVASLEGNQLYITDEGAETLSLGLNTRAKGTEIKKGQLALAKGSRLTPAAIGFLGAIGINQVQVFAKPSVGILITGNELQQPGQPLGFGQVYEASYDMLKAALLEMGITEVHSYQVKDTLIEVKSAIAKALDQHDVVLATGGVSVGDYDFVVPAALENGVQALFHKIKQRPGKPLFFGRKENIPFFGLPGNPASVLTCFYEYVWPLLQGLGGHAVRLVNRTGALKAAHRKEHALTHFLKGRYENGQVEILAGQESFRLGSFAQANCLVPLPEEPKSYQAGELVEVHLLPGYG